MPRAWVAWLQSTSLLLLATETVTCSPSVRALRSSYRLPALLVLRTIWFSPIGVWFLSTLASTWLTLATVAVISPPTTRPS